MDLHAVPECSMLVVIRIFLMYLTVVLGPNIFYLLVVCKCETFSNILCECSPDSDMGWCQPIIIIIIMSAVKHFCTNIMGNKPEHEHVLAFPYWSRPRESCTGWSQLMWRSGYGKEMRQGRVGREWVVGSPLGRWVRSRTQGQDWQLYWILAPFLGSMEQLQAALFCSDLHHFVRWHRSE